ncbi:MAG: MBL fold metallo-hydrolase, partial [Acidobacteriaceae bacterium]
QDHVQGLSVMARQWNVPVFATQATHAAWREWITPRTTMSFNAWLDLRRQEYAASGSAAEDTSGEIAVLAASAEQSELARAEELPSAIPAKKDPAYLPCVEHFRAGLSFDVGDISVTPFTIPHDAVDPVGFVLQAEGMRIVVATDLGYLAPNVRMHLRGADVLIIESNHDVEMLRDGPYPWVVKQRVLSRVGHLSNDTLGEYLASEYDGGARYVVLAHLSQSNNLPELARSSAERALGGKMSLLGNQVLLASQHQPLESIQL